MTERNGCKNGLLGDYEFTYLNGEMHALHQKEKKSSSSELQNVCDLIVCVCVSH